MQPVLAQRIENGAIAVAILVAFVATDAGWWWPIVFFLAFDLSALGYLAGPRVGATTYNAVHTYLGPAILAVPGLVIGDAAAWTLVLAGLWGFHVAADRTLGFGLKHADAFGHTHLGMIGRRSERSGQP